MIPTGIPASTAHAVAPRGVANWMPEAQLPRLPKFMPPPPDSKLGLPVERPRPFALAPADHHVEQIRHERRGRAEEDPRVVHPESCVHDRDSAPPRTYFTRPRSRR